MGDLCFVIRAVNLEYLGTIPREIAMLKIRKAEPQDVQVILKLIRGLAEYEHASQAAQATEGDLLRDGFGPDPKFHCVLAEWEDMPVGFALYFYNYSTWKGRPGIYLEDLFVWPEFRGKGIGKALLLHVEKVAVAENCGRYEWQVLDWNTPSIEFYEGLGAKRMTEWLPMRVEGDALLELARKN
jgi:GNAT superfamily N-acetyltransferase